jgi:glycogen synthase
VRTRSRSAVVAQANGYGRPEAGANCFRSQRSVRTGAGYRLCDALEMSSDRQFDVFLSHASVDEAWVKDLKAKLVSNGLSVWLDYDEVIPGDSLASTIEMGLAASGTVALVVSPESLKSGWVRKEYDAAVSLQLSSKAKAIRIIPVLLRSPELPPFLASLLWVDFRDDSQFDVKLRLLVKGIRGRSAEGPGSVARVCFISSEYPPRVYGGLGIHVAALTAALAQYAGVEILLPDPGRNESDYENTAQGVDPIPVGVGASYNDPPSWFRFAEFAPSKLERRASKQLPDVIHCHDWVTILAGIKCKWLLHIPLIFHVHLPNRSPLAGSIENLGLVCADLVTVNSETMFVEIMDRRLPIRKLQVVPNGVDVNIFRPADSWPADGGYILFVGRLVEQKGVEYLLRAFYYVREKFPDVRLKIVGDGEFREWLERLAQNLMLSSHVDFLGWIPHGELPALYQAARAIVVPSVFEPFGMVALEAFACKRPAVASRVGGLKEVVRHKVDGFLAEPKDHLDLAQWLMTLLYDLELRKRMGEAGFASIAEENYTWPSIAQQYIEFYEELKHSGPNTTVPDEATAFVSQIGNMASASERWQWDRFLRTLFLEGKR